MKSKTVFIGNEARHGVIAGVNKLFNAVASTLGPYGSSVIIENDSRKDNPPTVTKDGVSVARILNFDNQLEQLGARIVLQASSQADTKSGDGTTTTVVLAKALVDKASDLVAAGVLPIVVKRRLDELSEDVVAYLESYSDRFEVTHEIIGHVARISANGERRLADVALAAVEAARGGPVTIKPYRAEVDEMEMLEGSIITGTPINSEMVPRDDNPFGYENPEVIVLDGRIDMNQFEAIRSHYSVGHAAKSVIVFVNGARDNVAEAATEWNTSNHHATQIVLVETPGAGQNRRRYQALIAEMADCQITANVNDIHAGHFPAFTVSQRNMCINTTVDMNTTINNLITQRDSEVRGSQKYKHLDTTLRFVLGRRVTVYVGGLTDADIKERHDRMVDAVSAIECAREGVIPGGGTVLAYVAKAHKDHALAEALQLPMTKIYMNGGLSYEQAVEMIQEEYGATHLEGREYLHFRDLLTDKNVDLLDPEYAVYDPVRVTINAVRAACAVAGTIITSNCCIVEDRDGHF